MRLVPADTPHICQPTSTKQNAHASAARTLHSTDSKEAIDDSADDTPHSRPQPWWRRRICHIPVWILLVLSIFPIIGIILGAVLGVRESRRKKDDMSEIRSDYWYTISESDSVDPKGYLCDQRYADGRTPLAYPGTYTESNDTRELTGTHWQFLRANRTQVPYSSKLSPICETAVDEKKPLYWLLNRAQGPMMKLGFDNSKWYGRAWDEPTAEEGDEIRVKVFEPDRSQDRQAQLWYLKRRRGEDRHIFVNCDAIFVEPRRLGRTWDGRPIGEGHAGPVLTKDNRTESDNPTL